MATKSKFQAIKGTRDLLPPETALWNHVEQSAREVFGTFTFGEIRLPIFEPSELFARSVGLETDIVSKEMYKLQNELEALRNRAIGESQRPKTAQQLSVAVMMFTVFAAQLKLVLDSHELPADGVAASEKLISLVNQGYARWSESQPTAWGSEWPQFFAECERLAVQIPIENQSLRPEATASVCRAYIEHGMQSLPQPVKLYYMGPMFRRERPQKGRYRQFYQIGAEVLGGSDAPAIDAEVIEMVMTFFDKLDLQGLELDINSIGCRNDRPRYVELLRAELLKVKDKLGSDSQRRIETNPLRVLDSKVESEQAIIATLPHIADHLCADCAAHYAAVKSQLELRGVIYKENWRLVRGLDYYMRTTFEITAQGLGSQNAVCGGGRYDGLVELLGGPPTKGIGFAIGEDRLILSLQETVRQSRTASGAGGNSALATRHSPLLYIAWMGERTYATAVRAAKDLRNAGFSVELPPVELRFGKALGQADKLGAEFALILGENEISEGLWTLKTLADGTQAKFTEPDLLERLRQHRDRSS